jgi:hypothetical protein
VALAQIYVTGGTAAIVAGNITDRRPGSLAPSATRVLDERTLTAQQSGIAAAVVDVAGLSVTFTPQAGHAYRVTLSGGHCFNNNAATGTASIYITDAANNVIASQAYNSGAGIVSNWPIGFRTPKLTGLAAGTPVTYKVRASLSAGTDLRVAASAQAPWILTAEDLGV